MNQESILQIGDSCLASAFLDGRLQLMRNESDSKPNLVDTRSSARIGISLCLSSLSVEGINHENLIPLLQIKRSL